jgi:hypothetical protein
MNLISVGYHSASRQVDRLQLTVDSFVGRGMEI